MYRRYLAQCLVICRECSWSWLRLWIVFQVFLVLLVIKGISAGLDKLRYILGTALYLSVQMVRLIVVIPQIAPLRSVGWSKRG